MRVAEAVAVTVPFCRLQRLQRFTVNFVISNFWPIRQMKLQMTPALSGRKRTGMGKRGPEFTTEPNNPSGKNAFKYSGLANAKTIDVAVPRGRAAHRTCHMRGAERIAR